MSLRKNEDKGFIIADSLEGKVEKGKQEKGYKTSSFSCLEAPKLVWGPNILRRVGVFLQNVFVKISAFKAKASAPNIRCGHYRIIAYDTK